MPPAVLRYDRIDRVAAVDALLEILDARPGVERRVAELRESLVDLLAQVAFEWQPVFARSRAEETEVHRVDAPQLVNRPRMIVDSQIEHDVGELGVAAVALDDQERRRLPAAVTAALAPRGVDEANRELWPRGLERGCERVDRLAPTRRFPAPRSRRPCVAQSMHWEPCRRRAPVIDDPDLALVPAVVAVDQPLHDLRIEALAERPAVRPESRVRVRLRRDCADCGFCPRDDGADGEELHGNAH
jgi:hypothetical protein